MFHNSEVYKLKLPDKNQGVSGVILQPIELVNGVSQLNSEIISILSKAGIPITLIDYDVVLPPERSMFDLVGINNFDAGRRIAEHLLQVGAKNIHFFDSFIHCYLCVFPIRKRHSFIFFLKSYRRSRSCFICSRA